jgi:hypothetical protein
VGPTRAVLDVVGTAGAEARPITAVDDRGAQEEQRGPVPGFEVSHRLVVYPDQPWFLVRLNYVRNTAERPFTLKGYFFYLSGLIGGSAEGDRPAGPDVPAYYSWAGAAWQDAAAGYAYGAMPLDERLRASFWVDEGGMQHPDAQRTVDPPVVLKPGQTYQDEAQPWLLVYGAKVAEKPWLAMREVARDLAAVRVEVRGL